MVLSRFPVWLRLRTELHDLLELVLLPGLAAVLPWRASFYIFQRLARVHSLYRESCDTALQQARVLGWAGNDEAHWLWVRRLVTLVDHADHYLGLWRSDAWMREHLQVQGKWPTVEHGTLLLTFHWGAGFWGLRHAAANDMRPHALVAAVDSQVFQRRTVMSWYARSRNAHVARVLGARTLDVTKDLKQVVKALRDNHSLLGVVDVPADVAKASLKVNLLGRHASVPKGLMRLAVDQKTPVIVYVTGLDTRTGLRFLRIRQLGVYESVDTLAAQVFGDLGRLIAEDAPAWHFWSIADRLFR